MVKPVWYKPAHARLFHAFRDGVSLCRSWKITRPLQPMKAGAKANSQCGKCFLEYAKSLTCLCKDGKPANPRCRLHGRNPLVPIQEDNQQ